MGTLRIIGDLWGNHRSPVVFLHEGSVARRYFLRCSPEEAGEKIAFSLICNAITFVWRHLGPVSISDKALYRKISWSLEGARLVVWIIAWLWNFTGTSAAILPSACQISERSYNSKYKSLGFETSRDLTIRHHMGYRNRALGSVSIKKLSSYQYRDPHVEYKTVSPSYL